MSYEQVFKEASEKLPRERLVKCACDCALINIDLIKPYTEKFELLKEFLTNPKNDPHYIPPYRADIVVRFAISSSYDAKDASDTSAYVAAESASYATLAADPDVDNYSAEIFELSAFSADYAAKVSEASKQKVDKLVKDMMKEVG